jgi:hypothetical protein
MILGFYCFDSAPVITPPTLRQQWVATVQVKKDAVYDGFKNRIPSAILREKIQLPIELIEYVYDIISNIQNRSRAYMRGEVITTPAVLDGNGNVITPAVYAAVPSTAILLRQAIAPEFIDDIPGADCNTIVNTMIACANYTSNATWTFYSTNIKL